MSDHESTLGGRLPLLEPDELSQDQRAIYNRQLAKQIPWAKQVGFTSMTSGGRLIGPFNPVLFSPGVGGGLLDFMEAESSSTSLDPRVHEIVILVVGAVWNASYELYAHSAVARQAGLDETLIGALAAGEIPDGLKDTERAAAKFAQQLTQERSVDASVYAAAADHFGPASLVDLTLLVGYYQTVCGLLNVFEIPVPDQSDPQATTEGDSR